MTISFARHQFPPARSKAIRPPFPLNSGRTSAGLASFQSGLRPPIWESGNFYVGIGASHSKRMTLKRIPPRAPKHGGTTICPKRAEKREFLTVSRAPDLHRSAKPAAASLVRRTDWRSNVTKAAGRARTLPRMAVTISNWRLARRLH
jgi:hypothetical protein